MVEKIKTGLDLSGLKEKAKTNKELDLKIKEIESNSKIYFVEKGDTIASIAQKHGVTFPDLIDFNVFLGKEFIVKGKKGNNFLIKGGDPVFVPADTELFKKQTEDIKALLAAQRLNDLVTKGDINSLKKEIKETMFPNKPRSIGLPNLLSAMIKTQSVIFDPQLPRTVDDSRKRAATCANLLRTFMAYSVNINDLSKSEQEFLRKQNVDAWILPTELMKVGYEQKFNLMNHFDQSLVGTREPIPAENMDAYRASVLEVGKYLETNGVPSSYIPVYFSGSSYTGVVAGYNSGRKDKHYNTHQVMYAGKSEMSYGAHEFPEVKGGKIVDFGSNKPKIESEIVEIEKKLKKQKELHENLKKLVLESVDLDKNQDLSKKVSFVEKIVRRDLAKKLDKTYDEQKVKDMMVMLDAGNYEGFKEKYLAKQIRNPETLQNSIEWITNLHRTRRSAIEGSSRIKDYIQQKQDFESIATDGLPNSILTNSKIMDSIKEYNSWIEKIKSLESTLSQQKSKLEELNQREEKEKQIQEEARKNIEETNIQIKEATSKRDENRVLLITMLDELRGGEVVKRFDSRLRNACNSAAPKNKQLADFLYNTMQIGDFDKVKETIANSQYKVLDATTEYLFSFQRSKISLLSKIDSLKVQLGEDKKNVEINPKTLGKTIRENDVIQSAIEQYNSSVRDINSLSKQLARNKELLKVRKEKNVIDFLADFVEARVDLGPLSPERRKRIIQGFDSYNELIHITINGNTINIKEELEKYKTDPKSVVMVKEDDKISITGPMMIDGVHQDNHNDPDRREFMNSRTRFFWELASTQRLYFSELLEPGKDSSFRKTDFGKDKLGKIADKLIEGGVYDLRRGQTLEKVIKDRIVKFEQLDPKDPKFLEKLDHYYGLQVKALQMMGFIQKEDLLNKSATNINRPIPYFNSDNIEKLFSEYIAELKKDKKEKAEVTAGVKDFIQINVYPGDNRAKLFTAIQNNVLMHLNKVEKYPNLKYVSDLNALQKVIFMDKILDRVINLTQQKAEKQLDFNGLMGGKLVSYDMFIINLDYINDILEELNKVSKERNVNTPKLDGDLIDMIVSNFQNRNILKAALEVEGRESKEFWSSILEGKNPIPRKFAKSLGEVVKRRDSYSSIEGHLGSLENWFNRKFDGKQIEDINLNLWFTEIKIDMPDIDMPNFQISFIDWLSTKIGSIGDFQTRVISIKYGWEKSFIKKEWILDSISILERPDIKNYLAKTVESDKNISGVVNEDLENVSKLKALLSKPENTQEELDEIVFLMRKVIRLSIVQNDYFGEGIFSDFTSGGCIIGKILSIGIANHKITDHMGNVASWPIFSKNPDMLQSIYKDQESMDAFEKIVLLVNNRGEEKILYSITENYILRLFRAIGVGMKTKSILSDHIVDGKLGVTKYGKETFRTNLSQYVNTTNRDHMDADGLKVFEKINGLLDILVRDPDNFNKNIYNFIGDKDLRKFLSSKGYSDNILPTSQEFEIDDFQRSVFGYAVKLSAAEKANSMTMPIPGAKINNPELATRK